MSNLQLPPFQTSSSRGTTLWLRGAAASSLAIAAVLGGCSAPLDEPEALGATADALENSNALNANALNANALNANALNANALNANALNANALNANALSPAALTAILDPGAAGDLSRQLVKYVASCALGPDQSFSFSWTDQVGVSHDVTDPGLLGLATSWLDGPLDVSGQEWVSACLASRVNWYGIPVTLSSRGPHPALATESIPEAMAYLHEEGAFWGNLFAPTPALYTCHNPFGKAHARFLLRDCAAGHLGPHSTIEQCGMIHIVGSCSTYCEPLDAVGLYHPRCFSAVDSGFPLGLGPGASGATASAITVFLD